MFLSELLPITDQIIDFLGNFSTEKRKNHTITNSRFNKNPLEWYLDWDNSQPCSLVKNLREMRRTSETSVFSEVSIVHDIEEREIKIYTDSGRCNPLYIVENNQLHITMEHIRKLQQSKLLDRDQNNQNYYSWGSLLEDGLVEYIDTEEEETKR
jgi:DNA-directed RNA polymerase beta subunit